MVTILAIVSTRPHLCCIYGGTVSFFHLCQSYTSITVAYSHGLIVRNCVQCLFASFFCSATDDISRADEVKILIKDIWDLRVAKLRSSIDMFVKSDATHAKVDNKRF